MEPSVKRVRGLRNVLARKSFGVFVAGAMAVSGSLLAASSPASAASNVAASFRLCEHSGAFCVGASSLGRYDRVVETLSGRYLNKIPAGSDYELQLNADKSECVAAGTGGVVVVQHPCNGGDGTLWHAINGYYENNQFSGKFLSGAGNGSQFQIQNKHKGGWDQRFDIVSA